MQEVQVPLAVVLVKLEKEVNAALAFSGNTHYITDVLDGMQDGSFQAWYNTKAVLFTELLVFPRAKAINFFLAAGNKEELIKFIPRVLDYGFKEGCDRAYIQGGRRGWVKELEKLGWLEASTGMVTYLIPKGQIQ